MLKFEEEIKKFKPSLEVEKIQKNIQNDNMGDLLEVIKQMTTLNEVNSNQSKSNDSKSQKKNKEKE